MRKYLSNYLCYIDTIIKSGNIENIEELKTEHLRQIQFMQHERFIHLIVTVLFAIILFICIGIFILSENIIFALLTVLILLPLAPYIWHYYFLENSVQKMYAQYNTICTFEKDFVLKDIPKECLAVKPSTDI